MSLFSVNVVSHIIEKAIYLSLLGLGIYFVYQGDVIQRYRIKRTNFAEYSEPVSELPTIITRVEHNKGMHAIHPKFGTDYAIFLRDPWVLPQKGWPPFNYTTVQEGVNNTILVRGVTLKFKLEIGYDFDGKNEILRITPLHFDAATLHPRFSLGYFFANQSH